MTALRPQLLTARWVLPVTSPPIENGAVRVAADGRIEAVGSIEAVGTGEQLLDLGNAAILPGLVNLHAHPELAGFRGLLDDLPFHQWIPTLMRCKRDAQLTPEDYDVAAAWTCLESVRAGVTTMGATEASGAAIGALRTAGMRGIVYLEVFGPAPSQVAESVAELRSRIARFAPQATDIVRIGVSPHAPYTVSDALYVTTAGLAKSEGFPVAAHVAEAEAEELLVHDGVGPFAAGLRTRGIVTPSRGKSTVELLDRLGVLDRRPLLIHCVRVNDDDLRRIANRGAAIAHCPIANARLGHGIAPMVEARAAGITVGIGTDSVAANNRIDLIEEARVAQIVQRARLRSSGAFDSTDLLRMVTIDGARALGIDDRVGSLEVGKDADVCAVSLDHAHSVPTASITNAIFHAARGSDVILTMVQGKTLFDGQQVLTLPEAELRTRIVSIGERLRHARAQVT